MKHVTKQKLRGAFIGTIGAIVYATLGAAFVLVLHQEEQPSCEQLHDTQDAYRLCMQVAGKMGCHMTPDDFVLYVENKRAIEIYCPIE